MSGLIAQHMTCAPSWWQELRQGNMGRIKTPRLPLLKEQGALHFHVLQYYSQYRHALLV